MKPLATLSTSFYNVAMANLPGCGGSSSAQMDFLWSLSNADGSQSSVVLDKWDGPRLIIPPKKLAGGSRYKARVDVSMVTDPSKTTFDEAEITVMETPLKARISGLQTVGQAGKNQFNLATRWKGSILKSLRRKFFPCYIFQEETRERMVEFLAKASFM